MEPTPEAEWPDEFTREEMIEQQSRLLVEECRMLQEELSRYRKNLAQMIDLHAEVSTERDRLRSRHAELSNHIDELRGEPAQRNDKIAALQIILAQRESVMRQYKVPEVYFGSTPYDVKS